MLAFIIALFFISKANAAIIIGNPKGKVTLTEVVDYQCSHCAKMDPIIQSLIVKNHDLKVRLIPVAIINNTSLVEATSSYVIANKTNYFIQYHEYLMTHPLNEEQVYQLLDYLKLNTPEFQHEIHNHWVLDQMKEGLSLLEQYSQSNIPHQTAGTPLILIYPSQDPSRKDVFYGETSAEKLSRAIARSVT